jgi:membrane protein DedA with SNARE-associated domain
MNISGSPVVLQHLLPEPDCRPAMRETIDFLIQHGYTLLFAWVLVEQLGLPIPSFPLLLAAGALAGAGKFSFPIPIALAVLACIIADLLWYELGRRRGGKILGLLCRISLEPESCVRRTEDAFQNHASRSLLLAKFIPGLNTAAPPMAGMTGMRLPRFLLLDSLGALLYAGGAVLVGYLFSEKLERLAFYFSRLGNVAVVLLALGLAAYIVRKYLARRRFQRELWMARISPEDLKSKLDAGEPLAIVDLRHPLDFLPYPQVLPGAIRLAPSDIEQRHTEIPRDREVILYCT